MAPLSLLSSLPPLRLPFRHPTFVVQELFVSQRTQSNMFCFSSLAMPPKNHKSVHVASAGSNKCIGQQRVVRCNNDVDGHSRIRGEHSRVKRRDVMLRIVFPALFFPAIVTNALAETGFSDAPEGFRVYSDDENKFMMLIPQDWLVGAGEPKGFRSVTAFYPEEASTSNVSIVITALGADYTRLESFGKVDAFAENLVNGLDRSWQRPPGVAAKLIDCKSFNGLYYIEYSLQNPGESCRHIYSVIGMATNGWYNRLYTVTGQFVEEDALKFSPAIQKAVASFKFI